MTKSKKVQSVKENGITLVHQINPDRFLHGWYEMETSTYHMAAFTDGMPRDWHEEYCTVEEFETALRETANLRRWGQRFI